MRKRVALVIAVALAPAACSKPTGREAELGSYATLTPRRGVYARMLTAEGERWRATYDMETERVEIRGAWQKEGSDKIVMIIGADPNAKLWGIATEVLAAPSPSWTHNPELALELAVADGEQAVLLKTQGPFVDGPAKRLFDGIKGWIPDPADPANKVR